MRVGADCPRIPFDVYCKDPFVLGDICQAQATKHCCKESAEHQYWHSAPQADCFAANEGHSALDWLGRVERFDEDFWALLGLLNRRTNAPKLPTDVLPSTVNYNASPCNEGEGSSNSSTTLGDGSEGWVLSNDTENPCDKNDFFRGSRQHCFAAITSFYSEDMQLLAHLQHRLV